MSDETITWNGNVYFADPAELTMGELETIAQRCDITGIADMLDRIRRVDHIAWKALFWTQDRRRDPALRWDGYDGPTMRVILDAGASWKTQAGEPGKAPTGPDGSEPSPTSSDTPPPSSTG